jgi:tetratricopeptide (TPR) repeat protein
MNLAWALLDCGEYERGLLLYNSIPWGSHSEMKHNGMARALTAMGNYEEARKTLKEGLKDFPCSYALWIAMGGLYDELGDDSEALKCLDIALQFAPKNNSAGLYNKALLLSKLGCYGDALPIFDELIEKYPDDAKYLADRGSLALDMGYPQEALQYYQKAMDAWQLNPVVYTDICIYTGLCSTYSELGMKREALEIALEGLKKYPDKDPALHQNVAATFLEMGWRDECMETLKTAIEKFPDDDELKNFLKDVEHDLDDPEGGETPPIGAILLLIALLHRMGRKK